MINSGLETLGQAQELMAVKLCIFPQTGEEPAEAQLNISCTYNPRV
jgi:hypothetical protein